MIRKPEKILFICDDLMLGGWTSLVSLALELKNRGYKVSFITLFGLGVNAELLIKRNIPVKCIFLKKINLPFALTKLFFLIRKFKPDIVHTHLHFSDCFGILVSFLAGVKCRIVHIHSIKEFYRHKLTILRYISYRLAKMAISVSKAAEWYFRVDNPFFRSPIEIVYNGIDICEIRRRIRVPEYRKANFGICEDDFLVLCVANFKWQKGHEFLIQAAERLKSEKFKFMLVGYGPEKERIMKLVEAKNLSDTVFFMGGRTDIPELMKISDALLLPSIAEAFGICIIEAFAAELPVVASAVDGIKEIAKSEENAILTEVGNIDEICEALRKLHTDNDLRKKIIGNAKMRAEDFNIVKISEQIEAIYEKIYNTFQKN